MRRNKDRMTAKKSLIKKLVVSGIMVVAAACALNAYGTFLLDKILESVTGASITLGLPIVGTYSHADTIDSDAGVGDIISEIYPAHALYQMSYVNELGCETSYSINVSSGNIISENNFSDDASSDNQTSVSDTADTASANGAAAVSASSKSGNVYSLEDLKNYAFTKRFYTVTSITSLTKEILRPEEFLAKDMTVTHGSETPQILIFHTHSREKFADSADGDENMTIVGIGDYLTSLLTAKGYNVIHDKSVYDYIDGKLDRSKAYTYAEQGIETILAANPDIEVVIDLHRDGVAEDTRLVTEIGGKRMAKVMFFNGISYSNAVGDIGYLNNPFRDDNLAMSLQMQLLGEAYYPGYLRNIYINAYRYCLHERAKSMLIEAGAQTNTYEEVSNAMDPLADLLDKLLRGEKAY